MACRCWTAPYDGENPSPDAVIGESDLISLASSLSSLNFDGKKSDFPSSTTTNGKQSMKNVTASNDSGIHEDGLDSTSQTEIPPMISKSTTDEFQLPSWLANNEPIPEELLAKRSLNNTYSHLDDDDDDEDEIDPYQPSSFYGFSFIDTPNSSEDTWSIRSSVVNNHIREEMKTCVETLNSCLNQFRQMNEQIQLKQEEEEQIDEDVQICLNELIDRIEQEPEENPINPLDFNLLNELLTKKLTFNEYLSLLDRLIDNNILTLSSKTGEDLSNEIVSLADEIEHYKTIIMSENVDQMMFSLNFDNQYHQQLLSNTQSNYSVISFLQQSTSMEMSLLTTNELSNQMQSTLFTSTIQQTSTTNGGKAADLGKNSIGNEMMSFILVLTGPFLRTIFSKLENMLHNSLHVNLLLTGIIARLAQYSQPLLRSLLLNHSLVLETNVKSLFQVDDLSLILIFMAFDDLDSVQFEIKIRKCFTNIQ